jgi:hypothetical protein
MERKLLSIQASLIFSVQTKTLQFFEIIMEMKGYRNNKEAGEKMSQENVESSREL